MPAPSQSSVWLLRIGFALMLLGWIDPLEGSLLILLGAGLVLWGTVWSPERRPHLRTRAWSLGLLAFGIAALWVLSAFGGIGGSDGHSAWWALLLLPYPIGWWLGLLGPGTPRWALWGGVAVGAWDFVLGGIVFWSGGVPAEAVPTIAVLGLLGTVTLVGCLWRLRSGSPAPGESV